MSELQTDNNRPIVWSSDAYIVGGKIPGVRYELKSDALVTYSGIFNKKVQVIPLHMIERIDSEIGAVSAFFHCGKLKLYMRGRYNMIFILRVKEPNKVLEILTKQQIEDKKAYLNRKRSRKQ